MPLKEKFAKIMSNMKKQYGDKKGEEVFYATANKEGWQVEEKSLVREFYTPFTFEVKADSSKKDKVVGTSGVLIDSTKDLYSDICTKACLQNLVEQLNSRVVTMDVEHENYLSRDKLKGQLYKDRIPISKIVSASYEELDGKAIVKISDKLNPFHHRYPEVEGSIREGFLNGYSIAYVPVNYEYKSMTDGKNVRILDKVHLLNVTYTGSPVNTNARMEQVFLKSLTEAQIKDYAEKFESGEEIPESAIADGFKIEAKSAMRGKEGPAYGGIGMTDSDSKNGGQNPVTQTTGGDYSSQIEGIMSRLSSMEEGHKKIADAHAEFRASLKSLDDKINKQVEIKSFDSKPLQDELASLKAKFDEHEKVLSAPQFKARASQMADLYKSSQESKSNGVIDFIGK